MDTLTKVFLTLGGISLAGLAVGTLISGPEKFDSYFDLPVPEGASTSTQNIVDDSQ